MFKQLFWLKLVFMLLVMQGFAQPDTTQITKLNALAWSSRNSKLDTSILLTTQALGLLNAIPSKNNLPKNWKEKNIARCYYYLGNFFRESGQSQKAYDYYNKALIILNEYEEPFIKSQTLNGRGNAYLSQGKFPQALDNFLQALEIDEKRGFKRGISIDLANIGNIYEAQKNFRKALEYYNKALKIAEELKDKSRIAIQLGNMGIVYYELKDLTKALINYTKALNLHKETGNKNGIAFTLNNIASIYRDQHDYKKALSMYTKAQKLAEEQGNVDLIAACIGNIGIIYSELKSYKLAEKYLLKAIDISNEINSLESIQEFEGALSQVYEASGNIKKSFVHYKKFVNAKDSLRDLANVEKTMRLELNYEFEKKQAIENAIHQEQVLLLEEKNNTQKQFTVFLYAIIALGVLLVFFMRRAYLNKKRNADFLAEDSHRKELLLQEVHHRINNNLQFISGLLTLQANSSGDERLMGYLKQSQNRIESLSVLHELLYQKDTHLDIDMREYLGKIVEFHREILSSKYKQAQIIMEVNPVSFPTRVAVPVAMIVNELVTNSIKYAFNEAEKGMVNISLQPADLANNSWVLKVSDNGKGFSGETAFRKESLGLRLVNLMAKQLGGLLVRDEKAGLNFSFTFNI